MDLWDVIFKGICGRPVEMEVFEDNQAASRVVKTGKSQELRHVHRVHGVSIRALYEAWLANEFALKDCHTMAQAADIFTKGFTSKTLWDQVSELGGRVSKTQGRPPSNGEPRDGKAVIFRENNSEKKPIERNI